MSKSEQRDLFLVLTVFGLFSSFVIIFSAAIVTIGTSGTLTEEIKTSNTSALVNRARVSWPASLFGSTLLVGTLFSYRRYEKLVDSSITE